METTPTPLMSAADCGDTQLQESFVHILEEGLVTPQYQPIVNLVNDGLVGWEGLIRGPKDTALESPLALFALAERLGHLRDLERLCRERTIAGADLQPQEKLFLNIHPRTLTDPTFREGETRTLIETRQLRADRIVFEITEHQAIDDYALLRRVVNHYRKQGYQIALDDTGAGYSGLVTLMEVKPDVVKIDMNLIRRLHEDQTKQDIVRAICQVSSGFGAVVIAEGIETPEELAAVRRCGVPYGQGYLLGVPTHRCRVQPLDPPGLFG